MARHLAALVADNPDPSIPFNFGLDASGYRVRVGQGTPSENAARSNDWGSDVHFPMHSNAAGSPSGTCASRTGASRGTWAIYESGSGNQGFANTVRNLVGPSSPGTNDQACVITGCTSFTCLEELCGVDAPHAVYSETEFHDWNSGIEYLAVNRKDTAVVVGNAIDSFLGFP